MKSTVWQRIGTWFVTLIIGIPGVMKLLNVQALAEKFQAWGYPHNFMYLVGAFELCAAILFLFRRTMTLACGMIVVLMIGAIATHVMNGETPNAIVPLAVLILACWNTASRRKSARFTPSRQRERMLERMH